MKALDRGIRGVLLVGALACGSQTASREPTPTSGPNGHQEARYSNRLAGESSPYLLLHAHNPVDWYPWSQEAIDKAQRENKPIFLSIGYSTCYWCHVMEREVFSNEEIAGLMNDWYVSIKVDREERADLHEIYMTATQLLTGIGSRPRKGTPKPAAWC